MKRTFIQLATVFVIASASVSCEKKNDQEPKIEISETDLTVCPEQANCQYLFTERADIDESTIKFKAGDYRLFWSEIQKSGISAKVYVKAPMQDTSFSLGKSEILAGRVLLFTICPSCLTAPVKAVDGYVKGINLTPEKSADQSKWILEFKLVGSNGDTIQGKQYFYPNFVIN